MKKIFIGIVVFIFSILLVGCSNDDYLGTYALEYSKYVGDSEDIKNTNDYAEIILESDGVGTSIRSGITHDIKWSIDGDNIQILETQTESILEYNGIIKDNRIDLYNGDKTNAITLHEVFIKK